MDFKLSEEQKEMQAVVRDLMSEYSDETAVRAAMESENGYDQQVWNVMSEQVGLPGLLIPEEYGGAGLGYVELGAVLEETGGALLCAPFFATGLLAPTLLSQLDDPAAQEVYLPRIATGDLIATVAVAEDDGEFQDSSILTRAEQTADGWRLNGTKNFVLDGGSAETIFVAARSDSGVSVYSIDSNDSGVTRELLPTMDQTRRMARIVLQDVPARLVGTEGAAWPAIDRTLDIAAVMLAAEQTGAAQRALDMTVEYAKVREQFGRPIGSFQAIKHKCANMLVQVESMRSAAYYGMWAANEDNEELPIVAHLAKSFCSDAFMSVTKDMIQIHGGIGFTWEHPAHLYFKRAHSSKEFLGSPSAHREHLATAIGL